MYCNRLNFRSTSTCASAAVAKRKMQTHGRTRRRLSVWLRLVRTQATQPRSNRVIAPRNFSREETAAKAAPVPLERLANRRRSKREQCSRDICVVRHPQKLLSREPFAPAEPLPPPQKAMIRIKRRWFLDARSAREAPPDSCPTNRALASAIHSSRPHPST